MKKNYFLAFLLSSVLGFSQVIYFEDFQDEDKVLSTWRYSDEDRDGFIWGLAIGSEYTIDAGFGDVTNQMFFSTGFTLMPGHVGPIDSDNLLISPEIELPADKDCVLEYKIGNYYEGTGTDNNYQLFIIEVGDDYFPTLTPQAQRNFRGTVVGFDEKVDLSDYRGKKIQLFFRHYNSFYQWILLLDDVKISVKEDLATTEIGATQPIIYPNPVTDILHLKGFGEMVSYQVLDTSSRVILEGKKTEDVDVSRLSNGIYFIVIKDSEGEKSFKFIKK